MKHMQKYPRWQNAVTSICIALSVGCLMMALVLAPFVMRNTSEDLDASALRNEMFALHISTGEARAAARAFATGDTDSGRQLEDRSQILLQKIREVLAYPGARNVLPSNGEPLDLIQMPLAQQLEIVQATQEPEARDTATGMTKSQSLAALADMLEFQDVNLDRYVIDAFFQLGQINDNNRAPMEELELWSERFAGFVFLVAMLALATLWLQKRAAHKAGLTLRTAVHDLAEAQRIAHLGTLRWDYQSDQVTWSDEFARIYGLQPGGEMSGTAFQALLIPADVERVVASETEALKRSQETGQPALRDLTYRAYRSDGQVIELAAISELLANREGQPLYMVSTVRDVTDEVQAKRALLDSERSLAAAQRIAHIGSFRQNIKTAQVHWSDEMFRMLGLDPKKGAARLRQIFHPDDLDGVVGMLTDLRTPDAPYSERQIIINSRMRHADGSILHVRGTLEMSFDEFGQPEILTGSLRDVTTEIHQESAMREAVAEAERANAAKSEFLAVMSHELRTPMNGVLGMLGAMGEATLPPEQAEQLQIARSSADSLLVILNDILDMSKIEAGKVELEIAPFELEPLVRSVIHLYAQRAREKGIILDSVTGDGVPRWLTGDSGRIRQILANLVSNAVKFTSSGSVIVSVQKLGHAANGAVSLRFAVADTGLGIPLEAQPQVFGRFNQLDASYTRRFGGTGLGLSICRSLAELMAGGMSFESCPDEGSKFYLDLALPAAEARVTKPIPDHKAALPRMRILVAEDNNINQIVARSMLERLGQSADFALNGQEAIEAAQQFRYDLIFMDVSMPVLDGLEATRQIRKMSGSRGQVPILGLTAHAGDAERQSCLDAGFNEVLSKPLLIASLRDALSRWHGHSDAKDAPHQRQFDMQPP
ncbi:ATP-binding protein [Pseudorhodobacter sp. W20_MBD10_FR17]|uniref:PAS domain-containing hybrid sensor histidine kinase/response regulator n=1 Tax=Pseudorhodobacter sp. W20_MBD10_FR17 TaxID=3240266 RepID=UPI003F9485EE